MPKIGRSSPTVFHLGRMWTTIGKFQYRVLLAWIEIGRLYHHRFHGKTIARFYLKKLRSAKFVLLQCLYLILIDDADKLAISIVKTRLRRRVYIIPLVNEEIENRAYRNFMRAFARCYSRQTSPVELYAIRLGRNRTVFSGGKVKQTLIFIEALEGTDFPLAIGNLPQQFAVCAVVIKVVPTITLALPQKRAILQEVRIVVHPDPGFGCLMQNCV